MRQDTRDWKASKMSLLNEARRVCREISYNLSHSKALDELGDLMAFIIMPMLALFGWPLMLTVLPAELACIVAELAILIVLFGLGFALL